MKITNDKSIAMFLLSGDPLEKLSTISSAGFQGVEITEADLVSLNQPNHNIAKIVEDFGLKILLYQPFRNFEGAKRKDFKYNLDQAKYNFERMNQLNVDTMLLCSNTSHDMIKDEDIIIEDLSILVECAKNFGVKVGYEALSWGVYVNTYTHAWEIVKKVNHNSFGIILDSFHILALGNSIEELNNIDPQKIFFVQLADAPCVQTDIINWSRHFRCYPGDGDLKVDLFVDKLLKIGYTGALSLEIFNDELKALSPRIATYEGMLSMKKMEQSIFKYYNKGMFYEK